MEEKYRYLLLALVIIIAIVVIIILFVRNIGNSTGNKSVSGVPLMLTLGSEAVTVAPLSPYQVTRNGQNLVTTLQAAALLPTQALPTQYFLLHKDATDPSIVSIQSNLSQLYARILDDRGQTLIVFDAPEPPARSISSAQWFRALPSAILQNTTDTSVTYRFQSVATEGFLVRGPVIPSNSPIYTPGSNPDAYYPLSLGITGDAFLLRSR